MAFLPLLFMALGLYALYWTIRYAVRHALADADERRSSVREGVLDAEKHRSSDG